MVTSVFLLEIVQPNAMIIVGRLPTKGGIVNSRGVLDRGHEADDFIEPGNPNGFTCLHCWN
jgi:hypothetical protein